MELQIRTFGELTTHELYELLWLRGDVFVEEQRCTCTDLDRVDYDALHVFCADGGRVRAYLRIYAAEGEEGMMYIGRMVVDRSVRGTGLGLRLLRAGLDVCRDRLHARGVTIHAQSYAVGFYAKAGFEVCSDEFEEAGILHYQMKIMFTTS